MSGGITRQLHGRRHFVYEVASTSTLSDPQLKLVSPLHPLRSQEVFKKVEAADPIDIVDCSGCRGVRPIESVFDHRAHRWECQTGGVPAHSLAVNVRVGVPAENSTPIIAPMPAGESLARACGWGDPAAFNCQIEIGGQILTPSDREVGSPAP
jgi:hypothetical protein